MYTCPFFSFSLRVPSLDEVRLSLSHLSQSSDSRSDGRSSSGGHSVGTTSDSLSAGSASPDTDSTSLDRLLTTEGAVVSSVLLDLKLLNLSSQRRTVSDTVLTGDTNLLSSLGPVRKQKQNEMRKVGERTRRIRSKTIRM